MEPGWIEGGGDIVMGVGSGVGMRMGMRMLFLAAIRVFDVVTGAWGLLCKVNSWGWVW